MHTLHIALNLLHFSEIQFRFGWLWIAIAKDENTRNIVRKSPPNLALDAWRKNEKKRNVSWEKGFLLAGIKRSLTSPEFCVCFGCSAFVTSNISIFNMFKWHSICSQCQENVGHKKESLKQQPQQYHCTAHPKIRKW